MAKGYIYIMTNPCLKGMVKIGYTATDVEARRKQLSGTNIPMDYETYATYETSGNLEDKTLHKLIDSLNDKLRVAKNKEFYEISAEDAYKVLESIAIISGTEDKLQKVSVPVGEAPKTKKPSVNFAKCSIPVGAELVFVDDPTVKAIVVDEHKVLCNDELTSLSAIAKAIKGYSVAGPSLFTYNGKLVCDIAAETQWKE